MLLPGIHPDGLTHRIKKREKCESGLAQYLGGFFLVQYSIFRGEGGVDPVCFYGGAGLICKY